MNRSKLPILDDLRAFEAVARYGSVRAAADALSLTHGAVSRRVSKLSRQIGASLIEPDGRGIRLTSAGETLARAAGEAFATLEVAVDAISDRTQSRALLLSCERSVAMRWLIPRLSDFQDRHPDLPINLSVGGGPFDFERDGVTLAIRRLDFPVDPQWRITTLFPETNGPVMKPDMLKGYRAGAFVGLGSKTRPKAWEQWLGTNASAPRPSEIRFFDHHFLMVEAAAGGLGVAMSPKVLAIDDIRKERLAAPQGFIPDGTSYGLIRPSRAAQATESGIALLMKWLCALAVDLSP